MKRRDFIHQTALVSTLLALPTLGFADGPQTGKISAFAKKLTPVSRALEMEGYYVRCNSPIFGLDGKVHAFFSRWVATKGMGGWING
ncbi:MAG: hypothetical protein EOO62_38235 [Hymenobacter sp.]|nr:MAG: hypothetical protein EOO62_38235 [Hymenobacter sp.]